MDAEQLKKLVIDSLEDVKGREIVALDIREMSGVTDFMVVCSGTSNRAFRYGRRRYRRLGVG